MSDPSPPWGYPNMPTQVNNMVNRIQPQQTMPPPPPPQQGHYPPGGCVLEGPLIAPPNPFSNAMPPPQGVQNFAPPGASPMPPPPNSEQPGTSSKVTAIKPEGRSPVDGIKVHHTISRDHTNTTSVDMDHLTALRHQSLPDAPVSDRGGRGGRGRGRGGRGSSRGGGRGGSAGGFLPMQETSDTYNQPASQPVSRISNYNFTQQAQPATNMVLPEQDQERELFDYSGDSEEEQMERLRVKAMNKTATVADYQTQLMLLERNNKPRTGYRVSDPMSTQDSERLKKIHSNGESKKTDDSASDSSSPGQLTPTTFPPGIQDFGSAAEEIAFLRRENQKLKDRSKGPTAAKKKPFTWQIFHELDGKLYFDPPTWSEHGQGNFLARSRLPVTNRDLFLHQNQEIVLIVKKIYNTAQMTQSDEQPEDPKPIDEWLTVNDLSDAKRIQSAFTQDPDFAEMWPLLDLARGVQSPYSFYYHLTVPFASLCDNLDTRAKATMQLIGKYIDQNFGVEHNLATTMFKSGLVSNERLPYLFRPGELVVFTEGNRVAGYLLDQNPIMRVEAPKNAEDAESPEKTKRIKWDVNASHWAFEDRFQVSSISMCLEIPSTGTMPLQDLALYPYRFASEELKQRLASRCGKFWQWRHSKYVSYTNTQETGQVDERFMIDMKTYYKMHKTWVERFRLPPLYRGVTGGMKTLRSFADEFGSVGFGPEEEETEHPFTGKAALVFPAKVKAYNLVMKRWEELDVDKVQDIQWNKEAFDSLVLGDQTKKIVKALITNQIASEKGTDLIRGKGRGLIMLLHGGPGTGKTFTAESVAELAEKPLYRVTCGDVGTEAEKVEKYLESVLYLGKIWQCVVLLDEADVFLEQRSLSDLQRNALVSILLRVLEYYEGILILTSNRVGTFDEAFRSRIQLALHYPSLNQIQRQMIWKNFINHLEKLDDGSEKIDFEDLRAHTVDLSRRPMNGREIRNAITTARQLAKFEDEILSYSHLDQAIKVTGQFDEYLLDLKEGESDKADD